MKQPKQILNRKELKGFRITLRKNLTSAEAALWNLLKSRQIEGVKFRRQYSLGNYIADFCSPSEKLIIELDGAVHGDYHQIEKDTLRDKYLEGLGFKVLRFENRFVFQDPDYVISEIKKHITKEVK
jgi:very-short-patch-repair endonuclease